MFPLDHPLLQAPCHFGEALCKVL